ncbi:MAG: hypothetical protein V4655_00890 [Bdellovibrionota bacterium]
MSYRPKIQILISTVVLTALSCSKAPSRLEMAGGADGIAKAGTPPGVIQDPFKAPEKLSLAAVAATEEGAKTFDFKKTIELNWNSTHEIVMAHNDGQSLAFDFQGKTWTAIHTNDVRTEFQSMIDFRDAGFFAIGTDGFSLRGAGTKIVRLKAPDNFDEKNLIGANPGFVAYKEGDTIKAILIKDDTAKLYPLTNAPEGLRLVYPCNLHCLVWGYDGSRISVFFETGGWKVLDQIIELPAGEMIARMAVRFRSENNPVAAEAIVAQTDKGSIFAQVAASAPKSDPKWEDILSLSEQYCVSCHQEDGFDKESTWTSLKSSIVDRLKREPAAKGAMPPIETKIGQQMSAGERATVLAWIEKQMQTDRGEVGTGGDMMDTSDISGDLKKLADAHCISCHLDGKKTAWWTARKGDIITRVKSGSMPKGKTVGNDVKTQFEAAVNALK